MVVYRNKSRIFQLVDEVGNELVDVIDIENYIADYFRKFFILGFCLSYIIDSSLELVGGDQIQCFCF